MKDFEEKKHRKGDGHRGKGHHHGAKTFRRGRAMDFLEKLQVKRTTLQQQLEAGQFQEIKPVILGELKAIESIIAEYTKHFELHEVKNERDDKQEENEETNKSGE